MNFPLSVSPSNWADRRTHVAKLEKVFDLGGNGTDTEPPDLNVHHLCPSVDQGTIKSEAVGSIPAEVSHLLF